MDVREIKTYDLCRYGKKVWLRKFNSASGLYDVVISTDKRFETRGNLLYFEEGGLFWLSSDKNELSSYRPSEGIFCFYGFVGQKPLFSEGKTFFTIEPDEQKPGEVKSLGSRIIDCPDFWVFALQQKDGIVLTYLEPHDNTYGLHCVPGRGVRAGRGVAYSWEETGLCSGKIKTEFVQDTVFAGKRFTVRRACSELVKKGGILSCPFVFS